MCGGLGARTNNPDKDYNLSEHSEPYMSITALYVDATSSSQSTGHYSVRTLALKSMYLSVSICIYLCIYLSTPSVSLLWSLPNHQLSGVLSRRFATLLPFGVLFSLAFCREERLWSEELLKAEF